MILFRGSEKSYCYLLQFAYTKGNYRCWQGAEKILKELETDASRAATPELHVTACPAFQVIISAIPNLLVESNFYRGPED